MADQQTGKVTQGVEQELQLRSLYNLEGFQFVIPEPPLRGKFDWVKATDSSQGGQDALRLDLQTAGEKASVTVSGAKGVVNNMKKISLGSLFITIKNNYF